MVQGWFWATQEGIRTLQGLFDAKSEEEYQTAIRGVVTLTGRTQENILRAYRRYYGGLPPGKPRRKTFGDYMKAHPEELAEVGVVDPAGMGFSLFVEDPGITLRLKKRRLILEW